MLTLAMLRILTYVVLFVSQIASATLTSFLWQEGGARPSLYELLYRIFCYCITRILFLGHSVFKFYVQFSFSCLSLRVIYFSYSYQISVTMAKMGRNFQLPCYDYPGQTGLLPSVTRLRLPWLDWVATFSYSVTITLARLGRYLQLFCYDQAITGQLKYR